MKAYDSAEFLRTPQATQAYMDEALATGDGAVIAHAIGTVARARGMTKVARKTGLSRESLYRSLSADGRPELATVIKVMGAMGFGLGTRVLVPAAVVRPGKTKRKIADKNADVIKGRPKTRPAKKVAKAAKATSGKAGRRSITAA